MQRACSPKQVLLSGMEVDTAVRTQAMSNLCPGLGRNQRSDATAVFRPEIDIRARSPCLLFDYLQLRARCPKIQPLYQLANLSVLQSVEGGHLEIYETAVPVP